MLTEIKITARELAEKLLKHPDAEIELGVCGFIAPVWNRVVYWPKDRNGKESFLISTHPLKKLGFTVKESK